MAERMMDIPAEHLQNIFGEFDAYEKEIEKRMHVTLLSGPGGLRIVGEEGDCQNAQELLLHLYDLSVQSGSLTRQQVDYLLDLLPLGRGSEVLSLDDQVICHTVSGSPIKPKTLGQKAYVDAIRKCMITFGIGPAGTGKTYLAIAMAVSAFKSGDVERIILTRPAIEAGEKLGYLPGDLQSKIDPYLRPLYDALFQIMGADGFQKNVEKGLIEVAPLAYMRGRTLENAFIILDEAQNTTVAQMKMFLTRIGFRAKVVVTGDITQRDLPPGTKSGLENAVRVLRGISEIAVCRLNGSDVVRHPLVQKIVRAYETYENAQAAKKKKQG